MGVKMVDLAGGVALQCDAALLGQQIQDGGVDRYFGSRGCDDLGHAASSLSSIGDVLFCASLANGPPPPASLAAQASDVEGRFSELHAWIIENIASDLRVDVLAAKAGMTPRTFARAYSRLRNIEAASPADG